MVHDNTAEDAPTRQAPATYRDALRKAMEARIRETREFPESPVDTQVIPS